ncbi:MAG TPA: hypothetical protein VM368_08620, partial [Flavisolibacter sp.]|nr:hypothetical protein [Flavisolibacter sp.]
MLPRQLDNQFIPNDKEFAPADSGNASNPSPDSDHDTSNNNQLIDEKGEKYLREVASIEDYPDPQDDKDMDDL